MVTLSTEKELESSKLSNNKKNPIKMDLGK